MKSKRQTLIALAGTVLGAGALLGNPLSSYAHAHASAATALENDPNATVYVVTSRETYQGLGSLLDDAVARRDSTGSTLMVSRVKARQLSQISEFVHERELRCGGYFAFPSRAEADAFVRSDRSAMAIEHALAASYSIDNQATVNPWLGAVQERKIYDAIDHLSSYTNRYYTSATGKQSAEWIRDSWQSLAGSRTDVSTELFTACSNCSTQPSVIMTVQGTDLPNEIVVLGAHLDSINGSGGGSATQVAPGADDDASGIATLTEVIRVAMASGWKPKRTVKFMGYAAEEVGLRGSNAIAQSFKTANRNVVGVLQLDMTNYKSGSVEDMQLITDYSNSDLKTFLTSLFDEYLAPLGISRGTYTCGYGCSDHASWTSAGYPSAMMFEAGDSNGYFPYIHSANDTLANMGESAQNSVKFAKLGLAFLGELGKTSGGGTPGNTPPVANFTSSVSGLSVGFTDTSTDSDGSIASRSWNFGDGTSSTAANPSKTYGTAGTYTVTLTVTDNGGATHTKTGSVTVGGTGGSQTYTNGTDVVIRDNATVESSITVSGRSGNGSATTPIAVNIQHTYKGDLKVDLVAPDGTVYNLHNRSGGSADNINQTYTRNLSSEALNGVWKLRVNDNASQDTGKIDSWSLTF